MSEVEEGDELIHNSKNSMPFILVQRQKSLDER